MAMLSRCVISNNQPAVFLSSADRLSPKGDLWPVGDGRTSGAVWDMVAAFEGVEGRQFQKVVVFGGAGEKIAEFSWFPRKKRFFMLGVWPGQEEFLSLSKNTKTVEPFYDEVTDKVFYIAAGPATIFEKGLQSKGAPLRSVTVLASPEGDPVMSILTNCADKAPADIMQAFLRRWPNLAAGGIPGAGKARARLPVGSQGSPQEAVPGTGGPAGQNPSLVFQDWGGALNQYCQKHFFGGEFSGLDITRLISTIYSLNGYCAAHERALLVSLCPSPAYSSFNTLQQIIQRVNEAGIMDPMGRLLFINIVK